MSGPVAWRTRNVDGIAWDYFTFEGDATQYRENTPGAVVEPLYLEQQAGDLAEVRAAVERELEEAQRCLSDDAPHSAGEHINAAIAALSRQAEDNSPEPAIHEASI